MGLNQAFAEILANFSSARGLEPRVRWRRAGCESASLGRVIISRRH